MKNKQLKYILKKFKGGAKVKKLQVTFISTTFSKLESTSEFRENDSQLNENINWEKLKLYIN